MRAIGVDIGGTKISAALVDRSGNMDGQLTVPTDPVGVIDQVVELVNKLSDGESVCAVGVAVASFLNYSRDFVYNSPNLGLENIPIRNLLQNRIKFPVFIENDANAAAWAEWRFAPRSVEIVNSQDLFMITVGTGVGGAAILDGKILKGVLVSLRSRGILFLCQTAFRVVVANVAAVSSMLLGLRFCVM